jgi:hypothetical protein
MDRCQQHTAFQRRRSARMGRVASLPEKKFFKKHY